MLISNRFASKIQNQNPVTCFLNSTITLRQSKNVHGYNTLKINQIMNKDCQEGRNKENRSL